MRFYVLYAYVYSMKPCFPYLRSTSLQISKWRRPRFSRQTASQKRGAKSWRGPTLTSSKKQVAP